MRDFFKFSVQIYGDFFDQNKCTTKSNVQQMKRYECFIV